MYMCMCMSYMDMLLCMTCTCACISSGGIGPILGGYRDYAQQICSAHRVVFAQLRWC